MVFAAYLIAIIARFLSLASNANAAERAVPHLKKHPQVYRIDIPTDVGVHETSLLGSHSIDTNTAASLFAQQTAFCGIPATASGAARRTGSTHLPLTIDEAVTDMTTKEDVYDISSIMTVEEPTRGNMFLNTIAIFSSHPPSPNNARTTILDTTPDREASL